MLRILAAACVATAVAWSGAAQAQTLRDGIDAWLADDDATALPILSGLAAEGDRDAQLVLGRIDSVTPPGAESAFLGALDRRERIALTRAPSGLSGTGWTVMLEREGDPLATALNAARLPDADIEIARALWAAGEKEAAKQLAFGIFDRGNFDQILGLPSQDPLLEGLDFVTWMRSYFGNPPSLNQWQWLADTPAEGRSSGLMMIAFVAPVLAPQLRPGDDLRKFYLAMRGNPVELIEAQELQRAAAVLSSQMASDPVLEPVRSFCEAQCGEQVTYCALDVITRVGGYDRLTFLDTPYEGAISQSEFAGSTRARNSLVRWMAASEERRIKYGTTISQCVEQVVTDAQAG